MKTALKSQYHAGLDMVREAVKLCPDSAWKGTDHRNQFWQIAYHVLYFTHLYLQPELSAFRPWAGHQADNQNPDGIAGPPKPGSSLPLIPQTYSREQVLSYADFCDALVDSAVDALDLGSHTSGFPWYRMSKLEHQLVNLRHLQHHAAQLADRVRAATDTGVRWVGTSRRAEAR